MTEKKEKKFPNYKQAKQEFFELYAKPKIEKSNWQIATFLLGVSNIVLIIGYIFLAQKVQVIPYIVEVDTFGRAKTMGYATQVDASDEKFIRAFLYRFIDQTRAILADGIVMGKNYEEAYKVITPGVANFLTNYFTKELKPYEMAEEIHRQVIPQTFLRQSENTFMVEWNEIYRNNKTEEITKKTRHKALITITRVEFNKRSGVENNIMNPFGFFITSLSWDELK